jgi:hypothetical protein
MYLLQKVQFILFKINFEIFIYKLKMIDKVKSFNQFINENVDRTLTLYHGTCEGNGKKLIENGWKPINSGYGGNMGNPL